MKVNMGSLDRIIRIAIALLIVVLYGLGILSGMASIILGTIAVIFVLTGIFSFCPIYAVFGINSCKVKK